jgi:hypothetical protein
MHDPEMWKFVTLSEQLERRLPSHYSHDAPGILLLLRSAKDAGDFLQLPAVHYRAPLISADPYLALDQMTTALLRMQSADDGGPRWEVRTRPLPNPDRPNALTLSMTTSYRWAPANLDFNLITLGQVDLECDADLDGAQNVIVSLRFRDQYGWLMTEAHNLVNRTLQAIGETLNAFRSLAGRFEAIVPLPQLDEVYPAVLALERVRQANGLIQKGQPMEAWQFADTAVGLAPQVASTWWCRGTILFLLRNQAAAIADLNQAAALGKQDADMFLIRGFAYHDAGNFQAAIEDYQRAQQLTYGDTTKIGLNIKFAQAGLPRRT